MALQGTTFKPRGAGRPVPPHCKALPYFMMRHSNQRLRLYIKVDRYFRVASHVKFCLAWGGN